MKYIKLLPLFMLLSCKLDEPKVFEQYNCQLPSTISVIKDPANGKKFSFAINQLTNDVASLKWVIKNSDGSVVNTSNLNTYALTLANEGKYSVQAELISKCGDSKTLRADFEAITICNLLKYEYIFRSSNGIFELIGNTILTYNLENEVVKEETTEKENNGRISKYSIIVEKNEANLGSTLQPFLIRKKDFGTGIYESESIFCDSQKRVTKRISTYETNTYTYGSDGFLEQIIMLPKIPINPNIEYRENYKFTTQGLTITSTEFDKRTNTSQVSRIDIYTYSDQLRLPKYSVNYGFNEGNEPTKYFKNNVYFYYDYSSSKTPEITVTKYDFTNILDKNNQPISEKTVRSDYSAERRGFVFDCK
jgi:hypothetical protein